MEEVKRKRGRPKKVKLPEEIQTLVDEVKSKQNNEILKEIQEDSIKEFNEVVKDSSGWDVPLGQEIEYFDANLSYELKV